MGAYVEPVAQKEQIDKAAKADQYRGEYVPFGGLHYTSMILGAVFCGLIVYSVWFFQKMI